MGLNVHYNIILYPVAHGARVTSIIIGCYLPTHDMDSHVRLLLKCMDAWMPSQKQCCYYTKYYRGPLLIKCTCSNNYYVIAVYWFLKRT